MRLLPKGLRMDIKPNQIVAVLFVAGTVLCYLYEVWAIGWKDETWTITYVLGEWSRSFPILPLAVGILAGHLFFCQHVILTHAKIISIEEKVPHSIGVQEPGKLP